MDGGINMGKDEKINKETMTWAQVIAEQGKRDREIDNMLSPNRDKLRYITDYADYIVKYAKRIEFTSMLAHAKTIGFEEAQEIINHQRKSLEKSIVELRYFLELDDEE